MEIIYTVTRQKRLSERESIFLCSLIELGGESTAKSVVDKAGGSLTTSELYALGKRLESKNLISISSAKSEILGEPISRVTFKVTEDGMFAYTKAKEKLTLKK